jgi:hypothetical protein
VLTTACERLEPEAVRLLLSAGAPANVEFTVGNYSASSPLEVVIRAYRSEKKNAKHQLSIINQLLRAGARTRGLRKGTSALIVTCNEDSFRIDEPRRRDIVSLLHAHDPGMLDLRDNNGKTPLHTAVSKRSLETVKLLLNLGANVNIAQDINKLTLSVLSTAFRGRISAASDFDTVTKITRALLAAGADPLREVVDTPLLWLMSDVDDIVNYYARKDVISDGAMNVVIKDIAQSILNRRISRTSAPRKASGAPEETKHQGDEGKGKGRQQKRARRK